MIGICVISSFFKTLMFSGIDLIFRQISMERYNSHADQVGRSSFSKIYDASLLAIKTFSF